VHRRSSPIVDLVTVYFTNARLKLDYYSKSETEQNSDTERLSRKKIISSESLRLLPGPFSENQCDEFRSLNVPHPWVTNLLTTCGHPTCGVTCTPDTDLCPTFRRRLDYITRRASVRSEAVPIPEHFQRRRIMPSAMPSFESGHFRKDVLLAVARSICMTQPGVSVTTTKYVW